MLKLLKSKFLAGVFVLALAVVGFAALGTGTTYAANTCTAATSGDWFTTTNWSGCGGVFPTSADTVVIPGNKIMTLSGSATVAALTLQDPVATGNNGISNFNGNTLTVTGAVTFTGSSGVSTSTIAVGTGTLSAGSIALAGGASGASILSVSTGTITSTGSITLSGTAANSQLTSTGASTINVGGDFTSGGTLAAGTGTIVFNGSGAQNVGAYTTYNNVTINKSGSSTATLLGTTTFGGNLIITAGKLDTNSQTFTTTGTSNITGEIDFSTGAKTFTGDVTLNSGAVWSETGASTYTITGNWTNNATTFTASTGLHTFNGASTKTIGGTTATVIPSVTIATGNHTVSAGATLTDATVLTVTGVTLTNNGTITATASLAGTGGITQGAAGILNIGDASTITTLDASTNAGNTVNYTKAGAQTILDPLGGTAGTYSKLGISGSGAKTLPVTTAIASRLTIGGTATLTLSDSVSTANTLYFGAIQQGSGTWGATASSAAHKSDTYFTTGVNQLITVAVGGTSSVGPTITTNPVTTTTNTNTTTTTTAPTTTTTPNTVTCAPGQKFSATSGKACTDFDSSLAPAPKGYAFGLLVVKQGSKGGACQAWQTFLNDHGYNLSTDGACGKLTMAAARKWQASVGLKADGLLGAMSRAKAMAQ